MSAETADFFAASFQLNEPNGAIFSYQMSKILTDDLSLIALAIPQELPIGFRPHRTIIG